MESQEVERNSLLKAIMNYGAILGMAQVIVSFIFFVLGKGAFQIENGIHVFLTMSVISLGVKNYRDNKLDGIISYGQAVKMATGIAFFGSIVLSFVYYLYVKFVDPSMIVAMLEQTEKTLVEKKYPADQIASGMYYSRKFAPFLIFFTTILEYTFIGFVFSLIYSIFLKKNSDTGVDKISN
jgi:hypothetical protein